MKKYIYKTFYKTFYKILENTQTQNFSLVKYWKFHDWNLNFVNVISLKYNKNFLQLKTDPI